MSQDITAEIRRSNRYGLVPGEARIAGGTFTFFVAYRQKRRAPKWAREAIERAFSKERARLESVRLAWPVAA